MPGRGEASVRLPDPHERPYEVAPATLHLELCAGVRLAQPDRDAMRQPHLPRPPARPVDADRAARRLRRHAPGFVQRREVRRGHGAEYGRRDVADGSRGVTARSRCSPVVVTYARQVAPLQPSVRGGRDERCALADGDRPALHRSAGRRRVTDASRNTTKCRFVVTAIGGPSSLPADEATAPSGASRRYRRSPFERRAFSDDGQRAPLALAGRRRRARRALVTPPGQAGRPRGSGPPRPRPRTAEDVADSPPGSRRAGRSRFDPGTPHERRPKSRTKTSGPGLWSFGTRLPAQDEKVR